jgi:isopentenyl diphosphate isomerase/L-lactate dehydrogenase-like FMN-dependent dehydrogenase
MPGSTRNSYQEIVEEGLLQIRRAGMESFLDLGAETRTQNRVNRAYIDAITLEMQVLGSAPADTRTELFGHHISSPITAAALCESRVLKRLSGDWSPHYLELIAGGLSDAGSMMAVGDVDRDMLSRIVEQGAPTIHIVKPYDDNERVLRHLVDAEETGCIAVGMDVDVFFKEKAWDEAPGPAFLTHKSNDDLRRFRDATRLPFIVKGILGVQDALTAKEIGADAVVVSLHGGESLDYAVPVLAALPDIKRAVPDMTILVDSGFRRGTDVVKALALGAHSVGIATLLLIACAARGRDGVRRLVELLNMEMQRTMSLMGWPTVASADPGALRLVPKLEPVSKRPIVE